MRMVITKNIYTVPVKKKDRKLIVSDPRAHSDYMKYAVDFTLPEGTEILAARHGKVIDVKIDSNKGGPEKKYAGNAYLNCITIRHEHGEMSQYGHLRFNGSCVKVGHEVKTGEVIGYSGNTGWSTEPHLHFHVCRDVNTKEGWETMKIRFNEKIRILRKFS